MIQKVLRHLLLLVFALGTTQLSWGQGTTTASMTGTITDLAGASLPGATIIAVHTPTNTQYVSPTNAQGRYYLQNMRVGGPYTVRVSFVGFQEVVRNNITLTVGQDYRFDAKMGEALTELGAVTVTATDPRSTLNAERSGSVTTINTEAIQRLPTINRSLNDFLRLTPQAAPSNGGALAIGGGNYRQNNITVDGSDFNNNFGIGGNLPANGSPISIDAISELTVNLTPFDVRQSGFVGAAVNAVTRSGSNDFQGSIYSFYRNQNYLGNQVGSESFTKQTTNIKQYGFRLGGPIIKDKLFFFINAEKGDEINPGQQNFASNGAASGVGSYGSASNIARPSTTLLDSYSRLLQERYGYATGPYQGYDFVSNNTRILGRLDWNINDNNHFSIRYSQVESKTPSFVSGSRTPLTNYPTGAGRTNINALAFANSNYFSEANFYSLAAELNSTIGGGHKYYNTLRGTYTRQNDPRSSNSSIFPFVDILDGSVNRAANGSFPSYSTPYTSFGYEPFTAGNLREVETYSAVDFASTTFGNHTLTLGGQFDLQTTKNGFQRFATSYYTFNSWDDFIGGRNPVDFALTYSLLPGFEQAFPRFKTAQTSAYLQDEFVVSDRFRLTLGLRAELNSYLNVKEIQTNVPVSNLSFMEGKRIDTGVLPTNRVLFSPRVGFNWDVKGDRTLQLRGGSGVFTGKVPTVWIVAQSGDAGLIQVTQTYRGINNPNAFVGIPGTTGGNLPFNPDPNAYRPTTVPPAGSVIPSTLSATDPNFKNPQSWKSSLAVDTKLPGGIVGTLEGIYNQDLIVALGQNYNLVAPTKLNVAGYADNRDIYPNATASKYINPIITTAGATSFDPVVLTNGNRPFGKNGYYWSATAKLEKQFRGGLQASLAYVRSDARVLYDGTGDQLANTWSGTPTVNNANNTDLSYANYVVPDRVVASLSYRKEYINHLASQVSFFYAGSSQGRYSYIYGADFNRDGQTNDLIYIPTTVSASMFSNFNYGTATARNDVTAAQQSVLFENYISQDPYLSKHRGEYAERNGATLPWRHQIDFRFAQDIFVMAGKRNTLQFTLDVFNLGNLLNRNWGVYQTINNSSILVPTNQTLLVAGGTVTPTFRLATDRGTPITSTYRNNVSSTSTYYMQVGVRYLFN